MGNLLSTHVPHPPWAEYARRITGTDEKALLDIYCDALKDCPKGMNFAIRQVDGCLEWYAPIVPKGAWLT